MTAIGRYELIKEIGADVQVALADKRLVVVKRLEKPLDKRVAEIDHANVAKIYELGEADGKPFVAMEYLEGEPLAAVFDKRLDALSIARIIADCAQGLAATELAHHALTPSNVFVLYSGQVKLLDFGQAKRRVAYTAPEKLDERPGDRRSDIWSLGCMLWEGLTGKRLFKGTSDTEIVREVRYVNVAAPSSVSSDVPVELDAIVLRCLQRDPAKRYPSAKELASVIEEVLTAKQYPAKNFKIGTFMMQAFEDRVAAREQLGREVAGPERPSAEVIEAALGEKPAEPAPPAFDIDALLDPANQVVLPEGSTGANAAVATPTSNSLEDVDTSDPSEIREKRGTAIEAREREQAQREFPEVFRRRRQMQVIAAVGGLLVLVIVIVGIKSCGKKHAPAAPIASAPVTVDATAIAIDAPAAAAVATPDEIEMPVDEVPDKPVERPKPTKSAQKLYAEGLAAWKKNDVKTAYTLFTEGRRASSSYANNWYGLGLVHEKQGRKKDARTAYERYLKLAPNAPNAGKLRDHIKKNLL